MHVKAMDWFSVALWERSEEVPKEKQGNDESWIQAVGGEDRGDEVGNYGQT